MFDRVRSAIRRSPGAGSFVQWVVALGRVRRTEEALAALREDLANRLDEVDRRLERVESVLPDESDVFAGLDFRALRNQVESVPVELARIRRDLGVPDREP